MTAALFPWPSEPELDDGPVELVGFAVGSWVTEDKVEWGEFALMQELLPLSATVLKQVSDKDYRYVKLQTQLVRMYLDYHLRPP